MSASRSPRAAGKRSSRVVVRADAVAGASVDRALVRRAVEAALASEGRQLGHEVDVRITDATGIQALNRALRGVDAPTDVLSFPLEGPPAAGGALILFAQPPGARQHLGDIVLSWPRAVEQAAAYGHTVQREAAYLAVHGVLHLLGYDHERPADAAVMRPREEAILAALGLTR